MSIHPVKWVVFHELNMSPIAFLEAVKLGVPEDQFIRAVTADRDPARRRLIGYWETLEEAQAGVRAFYDPSLPCPPWKPPPSPRVKGQAPTPREHGKAAKQRQEHVGGRR